jgi:hypothetical protein
LTVPQNGAKAHVLVHGFAAGKYQLEIAYVAPR